VTAARLESLEQDQIEMHASKSKLLQEVQTFRSETFAGAVKRFCGPRQMRIYGAGLAEMCDSTREFLRIVHPDHNRPAI